MKKIVILESSGRLANQLWHWAAVYTYCLEKGYGCENYAFFRYWHYFNTTISNRMVKWFFGNFYRWHKNIKFGKFTYLLFATIAKMVLRQRAVKDRGHVFTLLPTLNTLEAQNKVIQLIESDERTYFLCGWLFRNPVGLEKYRREICEYFKPRGQYYNPVREFVQNLKSQYKFVVGVHIRQGDYKTWQGGKCYFTCLEVRKILDDFLSKQTVYTKNNTVFVLCSDENIDKHAFVGLNTVNGLGTEITDLYTLASVDLIIGSSSTYGPWAAYYGGIRFIAFSHEKINWSIFVDNV